MGKRKILIVVKTYPNVSSKYSEVVCTAGITDDAKWVRLYPIPYRYQPKEKQFKKYQWVEVEAERHRQDPRLESYRPKLETLAVIGPPLDCKNHWHERKKLVLPLLDKSIEELQSMIKNKERPGKSLGLIKPNVISDFIIEGTSREWSSKQKAILRQKNLFEEIKDLDKIPYKFSYKFKCSDERCKGHKLMIEDWEIYELYRKCLTEHKNEKNALLKVREKYSGYLKNNDVYFVVGTQREHHFKKTFVLISIFAPTKERESNNMSLFSTKD